MLIFVTVGTHEQQFDRLVRTMDELVGNGCITDPVFIQTGYSAYIPRYCEFSKFLSFEEMTNKMQSAEVVITHGGPSSFIEAMASGKIPVVVPRRSIYGEHVNDHQVEFVLQVERRIGGIIPCLDTDRLLDCIANCRSLEANLAFHSHNKEFCEGLKEIIARI